MSQGRTHLSLALLLTLIMSLVLPAHALQGEKKKKKALPTGTPVLWRDPGDVSALDLLAGPGGEEMKPDKPYLHRGAEGRLLEEVSRARRQGAGG